MTADDQPTSDEHPVWSGWREVPNVVLHPPHLRRTVSVALVVGTALFAINQLDIVLADGFSARVVGKICLTYFVPFCVSNYGLLVGRRAQRP